MFVHVDDPESMYYHVYDCLTGEEITGCIWANDEKEEYCVYKIDEETHSPIIEDDKWVTIIKKGKIEIRYEK